MAFTNKFKFGSQDWHIAKRLLESKTREEVVKELFPWVAEREPFIYRANVGGARAIKPRIDQYRLFLYGVARTIGKMEADGWINTESSFDRKKWSSKERSWVRWRNNYIMDLVREGVIADPVTGIPVPGSVSPVDPDGNPLNTKVKNDDEKVFYSQGDLQDWLGKLLDDGLLDELPNTTIDDADNKIYAEEDEAGNRVAIWEEKPNGILERTPSPNNPRGKYDDDYGGIVASSVTEPAPEPEIYIPTRAEEISRFYLLMMRARDFVMSRELSGEYLDFVSTRALKDGCNAIANGISVEEVMEAVTKTWPLDSKTEFTDHTHAWKPKDATVNVERYPSNLSGAHRYLGYVEILAKARIPIFLVGPSGCGKSFLARDLADLLDADYGEIPLTAGATPSWLTGAETITGYKSRPFVDIYENGGVFCFEEMDAADPNMLLLVNNAIANESFTNPVTGREIPKSKNFIPVATANTWGLGANRQFTGRERLDAATLDRWRVGRVEMDYDEAVERLIVNAWKEKADKLQKPIKAKPKKKKVAT